VAVIVIIIIIYLFLIIFILMLATTANKATTSRICEFSEIYVNWNAHNSFASYAHSSADSSLPLPLPYYAT